MMSLADSSLPVYTLLGTPLRATTYSEFTCLLQGIYKQPRSWAVDFSNTQIVTMRRHDLKFRTATNGFDFFIPDGMPLVWCLNFRSAGLKDRVYGPAFMRHCIVNSPAPFTHYFLGGSEDCLKKLRDALIKQNPDIKILHARNGYFQRDQEDDIVAEINRLSPDFIWVGLGTPKQQDWIHRNKHRIRRGILLAVGFAFDVNAGTKPDAPLWMQRLGLTWIYRMCSEPVRLVPRYLRYNSLFLFYLFWDGLRGKAFVPTLGASPSAIEESARK